jgi:hypothetical protein
VRAGQVVTVPLAPGQHSVGLTIDWCRSNEVAFAIRPGETVEFECGSSLTGCRWLLALLYVTLLRNEYLWLRQLP